MLCWFLLYTKWFSYTYIYILFPALFHYGLSQDIEYSSLCCTVGPWCLSILCVLVCICHPKHLIRPSPTPFPQSVLYFCESVCFIEMFICVKLQIPDISSPRNFDHKYSSELNTEAYFFPCYQLEMLITKFRNFQVIYSVNTLLLYHSGSFHWYCLTGNRIK